jgi:hypothetical protein
MPMARAVIALGIASASCHQRAGEEDPTTTGMGGSMPGPSLDELKRMARETFGRELCDAQAEAYRGRLPTMAQNVRRLRDWERRLGTLDPALVQRLGGGHD